MPATCSTAAATAARKAAAKKKDRTVAPPAEHNLPEDDNATVIAGMFRAFGLNIAD